jgi:hypothetical protein
VNKTTNDTKDKHLFLKLGIIGKQELPITFFVLVELNLIRVKITKGNVFYINKTQQKSFGLIMPLILNLYANGCKSRNLFF